MKRTLIALCAASAVAMTAPLMGQAQTTTADSAKDMTLTGCLQKNKSGGYWLTNVSAGDASASAAATTTEPRGAASSTTADNSAGSTTAATGTTGSASASTTAGTSGSRASAGVNWNLENGKDLDQFVNQKIQVTGHAKGSTSGDEVKGTTGREQEARDFDVKSVRMIAASCS
jgi:hypothetical protein